MAASGRIKNAMNPDNLYYDLKIAEVSSPPLHKMIRFALLYSDNVLSQRLAMVATGRSGYPLTRTGFNQMAKDKLNAVVDDIIVFRPINLTSYEFELISQESAFYKGYKALLNGKNHEVVIDQVPIEDVDLIKSNKIFLITDCCCDLLFLERI